MLVYPDHATKKGRSGTPLYPFLQISPTRSQTKTAQVVFSGTYDMIVFSYCRDMDLINALFSLPYYQLVQTA